MITYLQFIGIKQLVELLHRNFILLTSRRMTVICTIVFPVVWVIVMWFTRYQTSLENMVSILYINT